MMTKKLLLFLSAVLLFISCDKRPEILMNQGIGNISLSFTNEDLQLKGANIATPDAILITIKDINDQSVINNQKITLISFGSSYITEEIELIVGDYSITSFNIVDTDNTIIYASPIEGSEMAEFVNDPLPIEFTVTEGDTNTVSPEVIYVGPTVTPEQFGYTSFSFTIVDIPTEPETQDLYLTITDPNNNVADGEVLIEIPSQNFSLNTRIFVDNIPITIPTTEATEEVIITVIYEGHANQTITLNLDQITDSSVQNPFEILFETTPSDNLTLFVNVFQWDAPQFHETNGSYQYNTATGISGEGNISFGQKTIELPNISDVFSITFSHQNFNTPQTVTLSNSDIVETSTAPLEIYFGGPVETQIIYVSLTAMGEPTTGYMYILNSDFQEQSIDFSTSQIEIPVIEDGETVDIIFGETNFNIGYHEITITLSASEIETFKFDDTPLIVNFSDY